MVMQMATLEESLDILRDYITFSGKSFSPLLLKVVGYGYGYWTCKDKTLTKETEKGRAS